MPPLRFFNGGFFVFTFFIYIFVKKEKNMTFSIIACINDNLALGKDGELLYHLKSDLKNFKTMTTDNVVIMGRKTFESLPNQEPLKNRVNIIITSNNDYNIDASFENTFIVHNIEEAIALCDAMFSEKECFVIGGSTIYQQFLDKGVVDVMYLTRVNGEEEGDVYFPNVFETDEWKTFYQSYTQRQRTDETTYRFEILKKR